MLMNELDDIQSRIRENGPTCQERRLIQRSRIDRNGRSEVEKELNRAYWHTVRWRRSVGAQFFGVDD